MHTSYYEHLIDNYETHAIFDDFNLDIIYETFHQNEPTNLYPRPLGDTRAQQEALMNKRCANFFHDMKYRMKILGIHSESSHSQVIKRMKDILVLFLCCMSQSNGKLCYFFNFF